MSGHQWSDGEVDALVSQTLGEIDVDRFDQLLQGALSAQPGDESQESSSDPLPSPIALDQFRNEARRKRERSTQWLAAAAIVVTGGAFVALFSNSPDIESANRNEPTAGPTVARTPAAGRPSPTPTTPDAAPECRPESQKSGLPPIGTTPGDRSRLACEVAVSPAGQDFEKSALVLVDDEEILRSLAGPTPPPGTCVDMLSLDARLWIDPGDCSGNGFRAAANEPGSFVIEVRLVRCDPTTSMRRVELSCGQPEVEPVSQIIVEVR